MDSGLGSLADESSASDGVGGLPFRQDVSHM